MDETDSWVYVVTDVEADGPRPGKNSMLSFASIAVSVDGAEHGRFHGVLSPLPGAAPDPATLAWFAAELDAWQVATREPAPAEDVMTKWVAWVQSLPNPRVFAASPLAFDGVWLDYYLRRFTGHALTPGPYERDRLFDGPGLCLRSYAAAITGRPVGEVTSETLPVEWFGDVEHNHQALDDALGYANLLVALSVRRGTA